MTAQQAPVETAPVEVAHRRAARRHRVLVHLTQVAVLLVVVGGWQLTVQGNARSVILYGVPSGIVDRLITWVAEGTAIGSLGDQIVTTLE